VALVHSFVKSELEGDSTPQRNKFPSNLLAHAANIKESYESMNILLGKIKYDEFN